MVSSLLTARAAPEVADHASPDAWHHESIHAAREIKLLCDRVAMRMTTAGFGNRDMFAVRLALEEALINAIKHGHHSDSSKTVRVRYHVDSERALINVEDEGAGFDPGQIADPLSPENIDRSTGRGLLLMRHYMTHLNYNDRGNSVSMCKYRTM